MRAISRYLITGGAGFIGSHIAEALGAVGAQVTIVDDLSTGRRDNLEHVLIGRGAELIEGSVTDAPLIDALMADCDCCLHLASTVGVRLVVADPLDALREIVGGADAVISAAARRGKRVVFASTSEVYGKNSSGPLNEESDRLLGSPFKARWSYAIAKTYGEALAYGHHREHGADIRVVRLFNTIGPRQTGAYGMVVPSLVRQAICGEDLTVFGDGSQKRCFLHVHDAVAAIIALATHECASGRAFNVGSQESITIKALAHRIAERAGSHSAITFVPYEQAYGDGFEEIGCRTPDIRAVQELTGWQPRRALDQALDDVIAFQRAELAFAGNGRVAPTAIGAHSHPGNGRVVPAPIGTRPHPGDDRATPAPQGARSDFDAGARP